MLLTSNSVRVTEFGARTWIFFFTKLTTAIWFGYKDESNIEDKGISVSGFVAEYVLGIKIIVFFALIPVYKLIPWTKAANFSWAKIRQSLSSRSSPSSGQEIISIQWEKLDKVQENHQPWRVNSVWKGKVEKITQRKGCFVLSLETHTQNQSKLNNSLITGSQYHSPETQEEFSEINRSLGFVFPSNLLLLKSFLNIWPRTWK